MSQALLAFTSCGGTAELVIAIFFQADSDHCSISSKSSQSVAGGKNIVDQVFGVY